VLLSAAGPADERQVRQQDKQQARQEQMQALRQGRQAQQQRALLLQQLPIHGVASNMPHTVLLCFWR